MVSGNAEEGVLLDPENPSHSCWHRPAIGLATVVWLGGVIVWSSYDIPLPLFVYICLVFLLSTIAALAPAR